MTPALSVVSRPETAMPVSTSVPPYWLSTTSTAALSTMNRLARLVRASRRRGSTTGSGTTVVTRAPVCPARARRGPASGSSRSAGAPARRRVQ